MSCATQSTPTPITHATTFLTKPLFTTHSASKVSSLQLVLQSTLTSAFLTSSPNTLTLSLSSSTLPPRPIHAACVAANFPWSDWISVFGGGPFELHIAPSFVAIHMHDGRTVRVWDDNQGRTSPDYLSLKRRTRPPTLAQQLLESTHEDKEADEMFALLSKCNISIVSPTPTRGTFPHMPLEATLPIPHSTSMHAISFPDTFSEIDFDSRPSSRSSNASGFSFSSFASSSGSSTSSVPSNFSFPSTSSPARTRKGEKRIIVDTTKTTPTRYTYTGGVSTVLTGGVMLGSKSGFPSSHTSPSRKVGSGAVDRTHTTQAEGKTGSSPVWKPRGNTTATGDANHWRRSNVGMA
jgi:hypothetical protein